ncbi:hypothetical protein C3L33_15772, partial [Rhododendron williamsianum]
MKEYLSQGSPKYQRVVLFPESILPLRVLQPNLVAAVERVMSQVDARYTIGIIRVYEDAGDRRIRVANVGTTAELGFDIWWVYKELEAAKIMRENEKLRMDYEGAKVALEKARVVLPEAQSVVTAAEAVVEERRLAYEHLAEEARLGDRLVDAPLRDTDPFLRNIFGA